ncbi:MAG: hypothetical protein K8R53_14685 [Bacteroidales bacterium]|nr:hypothetical protein [Bacteroidales bacterium]
MVDRRKFIYMLGRGTIMTGLFALAGYLVLKDHRSAENTCEFDFICDKCKKRSSCSLPEAKQNKQDSPTN